MIQSTEHADGEYYHVYNRGAHKHPVFTNAEDSDRFLAILLLLNTDKPVLLRDIIKKYRGLTSAAMFEERRPSKPLVEITAYALMSNHFHLVLRQLSENGITGFMRKVCTAYSMYFNTKYEHSGVIFQGRYRSSHIGSEAYFRYIYAYIHLNPLELVDRGWKERGVANAEAAREFLSQYKYSSYYDYCVGKRPERSVIAYESAPDFLIKQNDFEDLLRWQGGYSEEATEV